MSLSDALKVLESPSPAPLVQGAQRAAQRAQNALARQGVRARITVEAHPGGVKVSYPLEHAQLVRGALQAERERIKRQMVPR